MSEMETDQNQNSTSLHESGGKRRRLKRLVSEDQENEGDSNNKMNESRDGGENTAADENAANSYKRPVNFKDRTLNKLKRKDLDEFIGDAKDETEEYVADGVSEEDEYVEEEFNSEDDKKKKKRKASTARGGKKSQKPGKWIDALDDKGNDPDQPKPEKKKRVAKPKVEHDPNLIKTQNKLIGSIQNTDLYDSDDDILQQNRTGLYLNGNNDNTEFQNMDLDFGDSMQKKDKKDMSQLFNSMKIKKMQREDPASIAADIGIIKCLSSKVSVNELAAKGVKISLKDHIMKKAAEKSREPLITTTVTNNLNNDSKIDNPSIDGELNNQSLPQTTINPNESMSVDQPSIFKQQTLNFNKEPLRKQNSTVSLNSCNNLQQSDHRLNQEEDDEGLVFVDPVEEEKARKEREKLLKKKEAPVLKIAGKFTIQGGLHPQNQSGVSQSVNSRAMFLQGLKNQTMQKKSNKLTFEDIKQTFVSTELTENKNEGKKAKLDFLKQKSLQPQGENKQASDANSEKEANHQNDEQFNQEIDGSGEEYEEDLEEMSEADLEAWDDEENVRIVRKKLKRVDDESMGEEDEDLYQDKTDEVADQEEKQDEVNELEKQSNQAEGDKLNSKVGSQKTSQARSRKVSELSLPSMMSEKERKLQRQKQVEAERKKRQLRRFLEVEAELGSDDEEKDDIRKAINRNDDEEHDSDLDDDLDGFVVRGDEQEIEDPDGNVYQRHMELMEQQDKEAYQRTIQAVLFGQNKKRRRDEVEGGMDSDEGNSRKMRRIEDRMNELNQYNDDMVLDLEGFRQRRMQVQMMQQMKEEEELSEEEIQKQAENNEYYQIKKTLKEKGKDLERFNTLRGKQDREDDRLEEYIQDLNQENKQKKVLANEKDSKKIVKGPSYLVKSTMIDKKNVIIDNFGNKNMDKFQSKNIETDSHITSASSNGKSSKNHNPGPQKTRGSYIPNTSSMMNFMKVNGAASSMVPKKTDKAYMFTKASDRVMQNSEEKNAKSPGFLKKKAKIGV